MNFKKYGINWLNIIRNTTSIMHCLEQLWVINWLTACAWQQAASDSLQLCAVSQKSQCNRKLPNFSRSTSCKWLTWTLTINHTTSFRNGTRVRYRRMLQERRRQGPSGGSKEGSRHRFATSEVSGEHGGIFPNSSETVRFRNGEHVLIYSASQTLELAQVHFIRSQREAKEAEKESMSCSAPTTATDPSSTPLESTQGNFSFTWSQLLPLQLVQYL